MENLTQKSTFLAFTKAIAFVISGPWTSTPNVFRPTPDGDDGRDNGKVSIDIRMVPAEVEGSRDEANKE